MDTPRGDSLELMNELEPDSVDVIIDPSHCSGGRRAPTFMRGMQSSPFCPAPSPHQRKTSKTATRCHAWSDATEGNKRRYITVLELGPVKDAVTAVTAVTAAIVADAQRGAS
jgi:hypothetical protein